MHMINSKPSDNYFFIWLNRKASRRLKPLKLFVWLFAAVSSSFYGEWEQAVCVFTTFLTSMNLHRRSGDTTQYRWKTTPAVRQQRSCFLFYTALLGLSSSQVIFSPLLCSWLPRNFAEAKWTFSWSASPRGTYLCPFSLLHSMPCTATAGVSTLSVVTVGWWEGPRTSLK